MGSASASDRGFYEHAFGKGLPKHRRHNLRACDLSPVMLVNDPRVCEDEGLFPDDRGSALTEYSGFGLSGSLLVEKCSKEEAEIFDHAGSDIAMQVIARIVQIDIATSTFHQESVVFEIQDGVHSFAAHHVAPEDRLPVSLRIIDLVSRLHAKGIIHGNVTTDAFRHNTNGQLVFSSFANARRATKKKIQTHHRCWHGSGLFISPRARWYLHSPDWDAGRCFVPTESEDVFAMSVTIYCIWAGWPRPDGDHFGGKYRAPDLSVIEDADVREIVVKALQQGGIHTEPLKPCTHWTRGHNPRQMEFPLPPGMLDCGCWSDSIPGDPTQSDEEDWNRRLEDAKWSNVKLPPVSRPVRNSLVPTTSGSLQAERIPLHKTDEQGAQKAPDEAVGRFS